MSSLLSCDVCNRYPSLPEYEFYISEKGGSFCPTCRPNDVTTIQLPHKYLLCVKNCIDKNVIECPYCKEEVLGLDGLDQHRTYACIDMYTRCGCGIVLPYSELYGHVCATHHFSEYISSQKNQIIEVKVHFPVNKRKYGFIKSPSRALYGKDLIYCWIVEELSPNYKFHVYLYNSKQTDMDDSSDQSRNISINLGGKTYSNFLNKCPLKRKQSNSAIYLPKESCDKECTVIIKIIDLLDYRVQ